MSIISLKGTLVDLVVHDVLNVPDLSTNLISIGKLNKKGIKILFEYDKWRIHLNQEKIIECKKSAENDNLFELTMNENEDDEKHALNTKSKTNNWKLWHYRLGHFIIDKNIEENNQNDENNENENQDQLNNDKNDKNDEDSVNDNKNELNENILNENIEINDNEVNVEENTEKQPQKSNDAWEGEVDTSYSKSDSEILPKKHVRKPTKSYVTGETMT